MPFELLCPAFLDVLLCDGCFLLRLRGTGRGVTPSVIDVDEYDGCLLAGAEALESLLLDRAILFCSLLDGISLGFRPLFSFRLSCAVFPPSSIVEVDTTEVVLSTLVSVPKRKREGGILWGFTLFDFLFATCF